MISGTLTIAKVVDLRTVQEKRDDEDQWIRGLLKAIENQGKKPRAQGGPWQRTKR